MAKKAMTSRQKQFTLHYLKGLPAAKAAIAAGYAKSTCERNAAAILKTPAIAARICRIQAYEQNEFNDLYQEAKQYYKQAMQSDDQRAKDTASREMRGWLRLKKQQGHHSADLLEEPTEEEKETHQETPTEPAEKVVEAPTETTTQPPQNQEKHQQKSVNKTAKPAEAQAPKETDTLPDGRDAYDIAIAPQKPVQPPPPKAILEFVQHIPKPTTLGPNTRIW